MKKRVTFLILTLIAMVTSFSFTSCSKDDDAPVVTENYYLQLSSIVTNCVDANGQSIEGALKDTWVSASKADSQGKVLIGNVTSEIATQWFEEYVNTFKTTFNDTYSGKNLLPEGGYINYNFSLVRENRSIKSTSVYVTNSGAIFH